MSLQVSSRKKLMRNIPFISIKIADKLRSLGGEFADTLRCAETLALPTIHKTKNVKPTTTSLNFKHSFLIPNY